MAFTYDLSNNTGKVRFHTGDTRETEAALTDEEIVFALAEFGTVGEATVRLIQKMIADVQSSFSAGGVSVNHGSRLQALTKLLSDKRNEFGVYDTPQGSLITVERVDNLGSEQGRELLKLGVDPDLDRLRRDTYRRFR